MRNFGYNFLIGVEYCATANKTMRSEHNFPLLAISNNFAETARTRPLWERSIISIFRLRAADNAHTNLITQNKKKDCMWQIILAYPMLY